MARSAGKFNISELLLAVCGAFFQLLVTSLAAFVTNTTFV
jgi:hypothetical protein